MSLFGEPEFVHESDDRMGIGTVRLRCEEDKVPAVGEFDRYQAVVGS